MKSYAQFMSAFIRVNYVCVFVWHVIWNAKKGKTLKINSIQFPYLDLRL